MIVKIFVSFFLSHKEIQGEHSEQVAINTEIEVNVQDLNDNRTEELQTKIIAVTGKKLILFHYNTIFCAELHYF